MCRDELVTPPVHGGEADAHDRPMWRRPSRRQAPQIRGPLLGFQRLGEQRASIAILQRRLRAETETNVSRKRQPKIARRRTHAAAPFKPKARTKPSSIFTTASAGYVVRAAGASPAPLRVAAGDLVHQLKLSSSDAAAAAPLPNATHLLGTGHGSTPSPSMRRRLVDERADAGVEKALAIVDHDRDLADGQGCSRTPGPGPRQSLLALMISTSGILSTGEWIVGSSTTAT